MYMLMPIADGHLHMARLDQGGFLLRGGWWIAEPPLLEANLNEPAGQANPIVCSSLNRPRESSPHVRAPCFSHGPLLDAMPPRVGRTNYLVAATLVGLVTAVALYPFFYVRQAPKARPAVVGGCARQWLGVLAQAPVDLLARTAGLPAPGAPANHLPARPWPPAAPVQ